MQADWSVELGADDAVLEYPWSSPDNKVRYYDIKRNPDLISQIGELTDAPELTSLLKALNSPTSFLETAKCDIWSTAELEADEELFGTHKFGSYIDVLFSSPPERFSFTVHETLAKSLAQRISCRSEIHASAEVVVRRSYYHEVAGTRDGFYITLYVSGYGDSEQSARQSWITALQQCKDAISRLKL